MDLAEILNLRQRRAAGERGAQRRIVEREQLVVTYRSDPAAIRALLPEPLKPDGSHAVSLEFIAVRGADGRGSDVQSRIAIPAWFRGTPVEFVARTFIDEAPDAVERWDAARRAGHSRLLIVHDTLTGVLEAEGRAVAVASMGYKHQHFVCGAERLRACPTGDVALRLARTQVQLRRIVDGDGRVVLAQLVGAAATEIEVKGAWAGPAQLYLPTLAASPLPVREVFGGVHFIADLALAAPRVLVDYVAPHADRASVQRRSGSAVDRLTPRQLARTGPRALQQEAYA
jgi:acetoacetate decarboxylase